MKISSSRRLLLQLVINYYAFAHIKAQTIDGAISVRSQANTDNFQEADKKGATLITGDNLVGEISSRSRMTPHRCQRKLGMGNGRIPDSNIAVSQERDPIAKWGKRNARLNGEDTAWGAIAKAGQWLQIDFGRAMYVSGIITKGIAIYRAERSVFFWVSQFRIRYKIRWSDPAWTDVTDGQWGDVKFFGGNKNGSSEVTNVFSEALQARILRIEPTLWPRTKNTIAMQVEILGCELLDMEPSGCGGIATLTNPIGYVSSMHYPRYYDNNANCHWNIVAPPGQVIVLNFEDEIAIEAVGRCMMEFVEVIDVVNGEDNTLAKLCGKKQPGQFSSTENILKIRFMTDHYEVDKGFRAYYLFVNGSGCGGQQLLFEEKGSFHSSNYPSNYSNNDVCTWKITVDDGMLVELHFRHMQIDNGNNNHDKTICKSDYLHITENNIRNSQSQHEIESQIPSIMTTYCGNNLPEPYISATHEVHIRFQSDHATTAKGFLIDFKTVPASRCGGKQNLSGTSGSFTTINYPKKYDTNIKCEWMITSPVNHRIEIMFESFELEGDQDCRYDNVSLYAGPSKSDFLATYCGKRKFIEPLISDRGMMRVIFVSDKVNTESGFKATYVIKQLTDTTEQQTTVATTHEINANLTTRKFTPAKMTTEKSQTMHRTITRETKLETKTTHRTSNLSKQSTRVRTTAVAKTKSRQPPGRNVPSAHGLTEEMAKWIIVGLASVSGLLILLVLFGIILCCRQHVTRAIGMEGSIKNNNSSIIQNHAYDFSLGSTNHSIRSRHVEHQESSQVSDSVSRQGTLRRTTSRDSHIYFSIEECGRTGCKGGKDNEVTKQHSTPNIKVHFRAQNQSSSGSSNANFIVGQTGRSCTQSQTDDSTTLRSEDDELDDEYYEEELESNVDCVNSGSSNDTMEKIHRSDENRDLIENTTHAKNSLPEHESYLQTGKKKMVDNILYISADSATDD